MVLQMACHGRLGTRKKLAKWVTVNITFCGLYDSAKLLIKAPVINFWHALFLDGCGRIDLSNVG